MSGRMPESGYVQVSVLLAGTPGKCSCLLVEIPASVPSPQNVADRDRIIPERL